MKIYRTLCFLVLVTIFAAFVALLSALSGCGDHVVEKVRPDPQPNPTVTPSPDPTGQKPTYPEMKTLLSEYCQACHSTAQFMQNENNLRSSRAKDYLWSRRMPPSNAPKPLPDDVRNRMITFF